MIGSDWRWNEIILNCGKLSKICKIVQKKLTCESVKFSEMCKSLQNVHIRAKHEKLCKMWKVAKCAMCITLQIVKTVQNKESCAKYAKFWMNCENVQNWAKYS